MLCCLSKIVIVYILFTFPTPVENNMHWLLPTPIYLMFLILHSYEVPQSEQGNM